jgi:peptidoglycan hydrolase-like protein with peptidoglycan-binding domain
VFKGKLKGNWPGKLTAAIHTWQSLAGRPQSDVWSRRAWMTLLANGITPVVKYGSYGEAVRRVQRTLDAASRSASVSITGTFDVATDTALRSWQAKHHLEVSGVAGAQTWYALLTGVR